MEIGLVGKPNVGKSTFFSAATMATAEISSYPFTTIEANRGVGYIRAPCPHIDLKTQCNPHGMCMYQQKNKLYVVNMLGEWYDSIGLSLGRR